MRAVLQRVSQASVATNQTIKSKIGPGLLILLSVGDTDNQEDLKWLCKKIVRLRIFSDETGLMNLSLLQTGGEALILSQFTLHANTKKGNRPSFNHAAPPHLAVQLYNRFVKMFECELNNSSAVKTGEFGANMQVSLINDGPVTIYIDSKLRE